MNRLTIVLSKLHYNIYLIVNASSATSPESIVCCWYWNNYGCESGCDCDSFFTVANIHSMQCPWHLLNSICSVRYIQKGKGLYQWVNANSATTPSCTENLKVVGTYYWYQQHGTIGFVVLLIFTKYPTCCRLGDLPPRPISFFISMLNLTSNHLLQHR